MSRSEDFEAYQKGYEDAMRAAGRADAPRSESRHPRPRRHDLRARIEAGAGFAFGWLVLFPLFMGLAVGGLAWLLGGDFVLWALVWGVLALLFAVFAGAAIVGFRLFLRFWPLVIGVIVLVVVLDWLIR